MNFEDSFKKEAEEENYKEEKTDRFTEFMFGKKSRHRPEPFQHVNKEVKDADYWTIVEQISDIMDSIEKIKPVLKELHPIVDYLKKKI